MARPWRYVKGKVRGAYGLTDFGKKTITINKSRHKKKFYKRDGLPKQDATLINTITHEMLHKNHPRMHEKTVRKLARIKVKKMSKRQKSRLYGKFA